MFVQCVCDHNCRHLHVYLFTTLEGIQAEGLAGDRWQSGRKREQRGRRRGGEEEGSAEMEARRESTRKIRIYQGAERSPRNLK